MPVPAIFVPDRRNPNFIPRRKIQNQLENELAKHHFAVLSGLVGSGKSALALDYAYQQLDNPDSKYDLIAWIDCNPKNTLFLTDSIQLNKGGYEKSFVASTGITTDSLHINTLSKKIYKKELPKNLFKPIAEQLGLINWNYNINVLTERLEQFCKSWLFIFDDITNIELIPEKLLRTKGDIICTSRLADWEYSIKVGCYEEEETVAYLARIFGEAKRLNISEKPINLLAINKNISEKEIREQLFQAGNSFKQDAIKLHNQLGGFPFAIEKAANSIKAKGCTLNHFLNYYQLLFYINSPQIESDSSEKEIITLFSTEKEDNDIEKILDMARLSESAQLLLDQCAYLYYHGYDTKLLKNLFSPSHDDATFDQVLSELIRHSILTVTDYEDGNLYSINNALWLLLREKRFNIDKKNITVTSENKIALEIHPEDTLEKILLTTSDIGYLLMEEYKNIDQRSTINFKSRYNSWSSHTECLISYIELMIADYCKRKNISNGNLAEIYIDDKKKAEYIKIRYAFSNILHTSSYFSHCEKHMSEKSLNRWEWSKNLMKIIFDNQEFWSRITPDITNNAARIYSKSKYNCCDIMFYLYRNKKNHSNDEIEKIKNGYSEVTKDIMKLKISDEAKIEARYYYAKLLLKNKEFKEMIEQLMAALENFEINFYGENIKAVWENGFYLDHINIDSFSHAIRSNNTNNNSFIVSELFYTVIFKFIGLVIKNYPGTAFPLYKLTREEVKKLQEMAPSTYQTFKEENFDIIDHTQLILYIKEPFEINNMQGETDADNYQKLVAKITIDENAVLENKVNDLQQLLQTLDKKIMDIEEYYKYKGNRHKIKLAKLFLLKLKLRIQLWLCRIIYDSLNNKKIKSEIKNDFQIHILNLMNLAESLFKEWLETGADTNASRAPSITYGKLFYRMAKLLFSCGKTKEAEGAIKYAVTVYNFLYLHPSHPVRIKLNNFLFKRFSQKGEDFFKIREYIEKINKEISYGDALNKATIEFPPALSKNTYRLKDAVHGVLLNNKSKNSDFENFTNPLEKLEKDLVKKTEKVKYNPNDVENRLKRAQILLKLERAEEAAQELTVALQVKFSLEAHKYRGHAFFQLKKYAEAKQDYLYYLHYAPGDISLQGWLKDAENQLILFQENRIVPKFTKREQFIYSLKEQFVILVAYYSNVAIGIDKRTSEIEQADKIMVALSPLVPDFSFALKPAVACPPVTIGAEAIATLKPSKAVEGYGQFRYETHLAERLSAADKINIIKDDLKKAIHFLAEEIANNFREAIEELTIDSVKKLAICAANRMIVHIGLGDVNVDLPPEKQLKEGLFKVKAISNSKLLNKSDTLLKKEIRSHFSKYYADSLFDKSGIETADGNKFVPYNRKYNTQKYGYWKGTLNDAATLGYVSENEAYKARNLDISSFFRLPTPFSRENNSDKRTGKPKTNSHCNIM